MNIKLIVFLTFSVYSFLDPINFLYAHSITRLTPEKGLPLGVEIKHLAINQKGDFVTVSHNRIYVGNTNEQSLHPIYEGRLQVNFGLEVSQRFNFNVSQPFPECQSQLDMSVSADFLQTKLALNNRGDFILASRTMIGVGNVAAKSFAFVYDGGASTEMQKILLTESGYFLASSNRNLFGGKIGDNQINHLVINADRSFALYDLYQSGASVNLSFGDTPIALNENGQFVAATETSVYAGSLAEGQVERILNQFGLNLKHVAINEGGSFVAVSNRHVFKGQVESK